MIPGVTLITLIWAYLPLINPLNNPLFMDILHFKDLEDTHVISECSLCDSLVIDKFVDVASGTSPL